ncbi:MAG: MFS transporter [Acidobacteria bacterium]|nr:MFS transporter [Acidobacteriota bacterium]
MPDRRQSPMVLFAGLFLTSMFLNTMPPLMVEFQRVFAISMGHSSVIPFAHSMGTILANVAAALVLSKIGTRKSTAIAVLAGAVGLTFAATSHSLVGLTTGIFFIAVAFAITITTFSVIYAHFPVSRQNFSMFHSFFGMGGLVAPVFVKFFLSRNFSYRYVYITYLVLLILFGLYIAFRPVSDYRSDDSPFQGVKKIMHSRYLIVIILLALYSVSEMAVVVWAGNFFKSSFSFTVETSAMMLSVFWILFTLGRFFGDRQIRKLTPQVNSRAMSLACLALFSVFIFSPMRWSVSAFFLGALFMATIFPSIHFFLNKIAPDDVRAPLNAILFLTVSTFGMIGVPVIGIVGGINIRLGMSLMLVPFFLMATILPFLWKAEKV